MCVGHGGLAPQVKAKADERVAQAELATMATAAGIAVPHQLTAKDFGPVVLEYVSRINLAYAQREATLALRAAEEDLDPVEAARQYADVIAMQHSTINLAAKMMTAAGALGIRIEEDPDDDPSVTGTEKLLAALADLQQARDTTMIRCTSCDGQGFIPRFDFTTGDVVPDFI